MGLEFTSLELGEVKLIKKITSEQRKELKNLLHEYGLELMEDEKAILVEKIVVIIIDMIHNADEIKPTNFSVYLTNKLNMDYHYLSDLFSRTKGITIEHFIILHKVERIKELIIYDELTISEISYKLNYSSAAHLSNQFKKVTGLTPSFFKKLKNKKRIGIDAI
jgi:YesN/AraC family two-component response regulator